MERVKPCGHLGIAISSLLLIVKTIDGTTRQL
jgi:hypothetical protein